MAHKYHKLLWILTIVLFLAAYKLWNQAETTTINLNQNSATFKYQESTETRTQSKKPKLTLHVGLPKTATTFLQCTLCSSGVATSLLSNHNLVFLGKCPYGFCDLETPKSEFLFLKHRSFSAIFAPKSSIFFPDTTMNPRGPVKHSSAAYKDMLQQDNKDGEGNRVELSADFIHRLRTVQQNNQDALMVFEGFHRLSDPAIRALADAANKWFDVQVVVIYRPLYQWLPSKFNSMHSILPKEWTTQPEDPLYLDLDNRGDFSKIVHYIESVQEHPAATTRDNFAAWFDEVGVIPLHALKAESNDSNSSSIDPLLKRILCLASSSLCQKLEKDGASIAHDLSSATSAHASHSSVSFAYDLLAAEARRSGMIPLDLRRPIAREEMEKCHQQIDADKKFEHVNCLPESMLQRLRDLSLKVEVQLFGSEFEDLHEQGYGKTASKVGVSSPYCWVDAKSTLQEPKWSECTKTISRNT